MITPGERVRSRAVRSPDGCLLWQGAKDSHGYGVLHIDGRFIGVHRIAYEQVNGPIPKGLVTRHTCHDTDLSCPEGPCRHRACIDPTHLILGTPLENSRDRALRNERRRRAA